MEHQVEAVEGGWQCKVCHQFRKREFYERAGELDGCPGVPQYAWHPWPDGLETAKQLKRRRLVPGEKRGAIWYPNASDRSGWLWLYRTDEATPKPAPSERQQAALAKMKAANLAGRTCRLCGTVQKTKYKLFGAFCRQCDVIQWARDLLAAPFLVLDFETSGLYEDAEIWQVGIVDQDRQVLLDSYVKPQTPIDEREFEDEEDTDDDCGTRYSPRRTAHGVNGITNAMVAEAPEFPAIYPRIAALLKDHIVVAYNAEFEMRILTQECKRHHLLPPSATRWSCAMDAYAQFEGLQRRKGDFRWFSLGDACVNMRCEEVPNHSGCNDALATLVLIRALAAVEPGGPS